ncbi:lambda family phage portal protein [Sphingomonas kyeonggiensis]|uniref:Lambda family phage portal protein n=1 Tax=Sphingomonas kyeonggiensis TaxID=1268553 RepID=A0A7W7NPX3_9SPHN|nr:phage portal protein [Sphingomonas kyeonggiensis]MBB4837288.1 lambda family phage portal protein [Sphingomonas kyeonggiensis]
MARQSILGWLFGGRAAPVDAPKTKVIRVGRGARAEYDGATEGRRAAGWRRSIRDANGELTPRAQRLLRSTARDLVRNNPFAARGIASIAGSIVGTGITFQVYRDGKIDDRLNALARRHFDTTACDASGRHDLYGLQLLAARAVVEGGSAVIRRRYRRVSDRLPLPFQIQVLEADYIDPSRTGAVTATSGATGGYSIYGIQFSPIGRREGYWLYNTHPGAVTVGRTGSTFVAAADIAHVFRTDRPEQEHGATWFAPVILRMRDFADFEDAELTRQKLAAAYVGVVTGEEVDAPIPGIVSDDDEGGDAPIDEEREPLDYLEPGTFQYARPGEEVTFSTPPKSDGYPDFAKVSTRAIAVGLGLPYEELSGDLSNVSFISGRLGRLSYRRDVQNWQWLMFIPQFCGSVERWFIEALEFLGEDTRGVTMEWTPPATEMLDPSQEVPAIRDAIRAGLSTISAEARKRGEDPDKFLAEWAADAERLDALGLTFDSDPRKVTSVGNAVTLPKPDNAKGK